MNSYSILFQQRCDENLPKLNEKLVQHKTALEKAIDNNIISNNLQVEIFEDRKNKIFQTLDKPIRNLHSNILSEIKKNTTENKVNEKIEKVINRNNISIADPYPHLDELIGIHKDSALRKHIQESLKFKKDMFKEKIDPFIEAYLKAECDYIANYVAHYNAIKFAEKLERIKSSHTNEQIEIVNFVRHEVSSTYHNKGLGLKPDAELDVFACPEIKSQTFFELAVARNVQSRTMRFLKNEKLIGHINEIVSPVRRAYQTAMLATLKPSVVDKVTISNLFAETRHFSKHNLLSWIHVSGKATQTSSEVKQLFDEVGYKNVIADKHFENNGETKKEINIRAQNAFDLLNKNYTEENLDNTTLTYVVAHGNINKAMIKHFDDKIKPKFNFGDQYQFFIARNEKSEIINKGFFGNVDHFGKAYQAENEMIQENNNHYKRNN